MAWWVWLLDIVGAVLLLAALLGIALVLRRRLLERGGGTFELSVRVPDLDPDTRDDPHGRGRGWVLGLGRYRGEELEWFRIFSPRLRPRRVWRRPELVLVEQRQPGHAERRALYADHVVICCDTPDGDVELALDPDSLTGLSSWLEAGPPGSRGAGAGG